MNLTHYSIGSLRVNYKLDARENAAIHKSMQKMYTDKLLKYFTDDGCFDVHTPWGPNAHIVVSVVALDKNGISVVKPASIKITPCPDSEDELPVQASWMEWELMVLEGLTRVCTSAFIKPSEDLSLDLIKKIQCYKEKPQTQTKPVEMHSGPKTGFYEKVWGTDTVLPFNSQDTTVSTITTSQAQLNTWISVSPAATVPPTEPHSRSNNKTNDPYSKKKLSLKTDPSSEFTLAPIEHTQPPIDNTHRAGLLNKLLSLFKRK